MQRYLVRWKTNASQVLKKPFRLLIYHLSIGDNHNFALTIFSYSSHIVSAPVTLLSNYETTLTHHAFFFLLRNKFMAWLPNYSETQANL